MSSQGKNLIEKPRGLGRIIFAAKGDRRGLLTLHPYIQMASQAKGEEPGGWSAVFAQLREIDGPIANTDR
jgi:hypothetical protein